LSLVDVVVKYFIHGVYISKQLINKLLCVRSYNYFSILELYSEPDVAASKPPVRDEYAEPMDSLQPAQNPEELLANPIYEGIYSEPLYGIAGTILVGPQVTLFIPFFNMWSV
jgi:hypothetical protein